MLIRATLSSFLITTTLALAAPPKATVKRSNLGHFRDIGRFVSNIEQQNDYLSEEEEANLSAAIMGTEISPDTSGLPEFDKKKTIFTVERGDTPEDSRIYIVPENFERSMKGGGAFRAVAQAYFIVAGIQPNKALEKRRKGSNRTFEEDLLEGGQEYAKSITVNNIQINVFQNGSERPGRLPPPVGGFPVGNNLPTQYQQDAATLVGYIASLDPVIKFQAQQELIKMGRAAVPHLQLALRGNDVSLAKEAAFVLGDIGPDASAACPALNDFYRRYQGSGDETSVKITALGALHRIGTRAAREAELAIENDHMRSRRASYAELGESVLAPYRTAHELIALKNAIKLEREKGKCVCNANCRFFKGVAVETASHYDFNVDSETAAGAWNQCRSDMLRTCLGLGGVGQGTWGDALSREGYSLGCNHPTNRNG